MRLLVRVDLAKSVRGAHTCIKAIEGCIKALGLAGSGKRLGAFGCVQCETWPEGKRRNKGKFGLLAGLAVGVDLT